MITQPEEDLVTAKNLQAHLQSVRNNITLNEAELNRLSRLIDSESYTVKELMAQKKYAEDEVAKAQKQLIAVRDEIKESEAQLGKVAKELKKQQDAIASEQKRYSQILVDNEVKKKEHAGKENELQIKAEQIEQKGRDVEAYKEHVTHREKVVVEKEKKIQSLVDIINKALV